MLKECIDVCRPTDIIAKEQSELGAKGYVLVGQHGGGDIGSSLVYAKAENWDEDAIISVMHSEHMARVEQYWRAMKGLVVNNG